MNSKAYPDPYQTSKMSVFAKIVNDWKPTIFAKQSIFDVWQGSDYTSGLDKNTPIATQIVGWKFWET